MEVRRVRGVKGVSGMHSGDGVRPVSSMNVEGERGLGDVSGV